VKKLLFITNKVQATAIGGREQLSTLILATLSGLGGDQFKLVELDGSEKGTGVTNFARLRGYVDGVSERKIAAIVTMIDQLNIEQVFINGSNLGKIARGIRAARPTIEITTFFHNCEARFFLGAARRYLSVRSLGVVFANYLAERDAVRFSNKLITLNERDSQVLRRVYGRRGTHVLPMMVADKWSGSHLGADLPIREAYLLFVGGSFYANLQGIIWFSEKVAPHLAITTVAVGKGLVDSRELLERTGNVRVIGQVEDLEPWYLGAQCVIAPIFDGSGMKTKVAEALMFGKRVVGTPEAFVGYEKAHDIGSVCRTPAEFIKALEKEGAVAAPHVDPRLREIFEVNYSCAAAKSGLAAILSD